jgi:iron complex outermembrane receptor protein
MLKRLIYTIILLIYTGSITGILAQQIIITGKITDGNGIPLEGVNIYFQNSFRGTSSNSNGNFILQNQASPPQILVYSMVGYETRLDTLTTTGSFQFDIILKEKIMLGNEVIISASRIEESILSSPVTIEKLDITKISNMPSANFFDGLYRLKGVDMNVQSLTLRNPNTRGFNGNTNFRFNQIIDGVNNTSPGLSFAAGNLFGISQLDVESVELLTGASSALYGAGGMNGTLIINSKSPFKYQGLSGSMQTGLMHLGSGENISPTPYYDFGLRYAKTIKDRWAFKVVASYLHANDWYANDTRDKGNLNNISSTRSSNPGYDGVNIYGDDYALNLKSVAGDVAKGFAEKLGLTPGTPAYDSSYNFIYNSVPDQNVTRTGWMEKDLANYNAENLKTSLSVHYRISDSTEASIQSNYSKGQAIYTAQNRFSANNFWLMNFKAEIKSSRYFIRYWYVTEDAGNSYDAGATAALINEAWKPSSQWYSDYIANYLQNKLLGSTEADAHHIARLVADNRDSKGNIQNPEKPAIPLAGSPEFQNLFNDIVNKPIKQGGSRVLDFSSMGQLEGMYNFSKLLKGIDILAGFQYRRTTVNSHNTVFFERNGPVFINEIGGYAQYRGKFFDDRLKLNLSARWDKNQYFKSQFTPRASLVLITGQNRLNNFRLSAQTAFRFPSVADQWLDIMVGGSHVLGGHKEVQDYYGLSDSPVYPLNGVNAIFAVPDTSNGPFHIPAFKPERVVALEAGYKSMILDQHMMLDVSVYHNRYSGFLANQLLVQNPYTPQEKRYQTTISTDRAITNWGLAMGADYQFLRSFYTGANFAYTTLESGMVNQPGLQTQFNTPETRCNIFVGNPYLTRKLGFNINYHWQEAFLWQSTFGVGEIPAYSALDVQLSMRFPSIKSVVRMGGSNVLNHYYTTTFGGSEIGGLYYLSFIYDQLFNN